MFVEAIPDCPWSEAQCEAFRKVHAPGSTDEQAILFLSDCAARRLVPGRHVYFQLRPSKEYSTEARSYVSVAKATHMTSIDTFRLVAERTGKYRGPLPAKYIYLDDNGEPNVVSSVPLPDPKDKTAARQPWAVRFSVRRADFEEPVEATARFEAYAQYVKGDRGYNLNSMWSRRGPEMCEKCSEAMALRRAFPEELGGLHIAEELREDPEQQAAAPAEPQPVVQPPAPVSAPPVDHTPAQPTDAPRPGEEKKRGRKKKEEGAQHERTVPSGSGQAGTSETVGVAPAPEPTGTGMPVDAGSSPAASTKTDPYDGTVPNIHGVYVSDADLPDMSGKTEPPPPAVEHREETQPERLARVEKVRGYVAILGNSDGLKRWICAQAKVAQPQDIKDAAAWKPLLDKLDEAAAGGKDALLKLISGGAA